MKSKNPQLKGYVKARTIVLLLIIITGMIVWQIYTLFLSDLSDYIGTSPTMQFLVVVEVLLISFLWYAMCYGYKHPSATYGKVFVRM